MCCTERAYHLGFRNHCLLHSFPAFDAFLNCTFYYGKFQAYTKEERAEQWISTYSSFSFGNHQFRINTTSSIPPWLYPSQPHYFKIQPRELELDCFITFCSPLYVFFPRNGIICIMATPNHLNAALRFHSSVVACLPKYKIQKKHFPASLAPGPIHETWVLKVRPTWHKPLAGTRAMGGNRRGGAYVPTLRCRSASCSWKLTWEHIPSAFPMSLWIF